VKNKNQNSKNIC